jgi:HKD family nuclease
LKEDIGIVLVENKGPNNLRDELRKSFQISSHVDIAVAFITLNGLNLILSDVTKFLDKKNSRMRVLTRISKDAFNEPAALKCLLDLCKDYKERCEVKTTTLVNGFHEKMYFFGRGKSITIFIGSSNLTDKALEGEGEINVRIKVSSLSGISKQVAENFAEYWNDADELTDERVDTYASFYAYIHSKKMDEKAKRLWSNVSGTMRKKLTKKVPFPLKREVWLDNITGYLKPETIKIVNEYTSWDKLEYYSCGRETYKKVNRGDILIIADHHDKWLSANRIKSKTKTRRTDDGMYFVAFQRIKGSKRRKITHELFSNMRESGTIGKAKELRPSSARRLTDEKTKRFSKLLNFKYL